MRSVYKSHASKIQIQAAENGSIIITMDGAKDGLRVSGTMNALIVERFAVPADGDCTACAAKRLPMTPVLPEEMVENG